MQWEWSYTMCWQQNCPKMLNLQPFPSPSFSPLCRSSLHMSFLSCQFPGGTVMWVTPLLWSGLKITLPKPAPPLKPADCVFAPGDTQFLWHSLVPGERQKTVSGAIFSGSKGSVWLARHRIQAMQIQPFPAAEFFKSTSHLNNSTENSDWFCSSAKKKFWCSLGASF